VAQVTVGSGNHHVVAVHGWFGSARGWGSLPDYLDGSKYTYVFIDLLSAEVMRQTWLAYFPGAELEVMANGGHYPMFETPVALATSIEEFLARE
jgi:pimeloyl-ACP methyl ester carboxylesterase